ncbi:hypothetical protein [Aquamicrobium sp. LC103]|uniref:hypothetical protein n=1 Tax=Aquamicrobium sp. LC103 TaxID=1120658 RepID=UPI00063E7C80|nr:hypothetical protein [Aquamicrobium sp. LC103]TKT81113.1 hypothetical protein XW59_004355 [Aquamicrobium sp. LC103]
MIEFTVNFVLKFFHLFGLLLGAAAGFGSMAVARQARRSGGKPPAELLALRPFFARMALAGIALLWVTGLGLWAFRYDFVRLGLAFDLKMLVALLLLAVIVAINMIMRRATAAGTPPPAWLPKLGMTTPVLTLTAVALAVWVFV